VPSLRRQEGYLSVDHRDSPGLPRGFGFVPGKPLPPSAPKGVHVESPTYTCAHCGAIVWMDPLRTRPHEYCARCDHYVCPTPACSLDCRPLMKLLEQFDKAAPNTVLVGPDGRPLRKAG